MSLVLCLLVAAIIFIVCGQCSDQPYMLRIANRAEGSNSVNLQCKDQYGVQVPGASFYRNSQQITNSGCLMAYPTGSSSELNLTLASQECDGYFSCGLNGSLSEPEPLYACPRTNVSADRRTEVIEEGTNFLLTCDFPPSPIKQYTTVWYEGQGSLATDIQDTPELQSYTLLSAHPNKYSCQVQPSINKCNLFYNSIIEIQVKERYEPPMITKDLNYTRHNSGSGGVFSVSTSGTNLTHKWYKNDKLINSTGAGILAFGNDALTIEDSNGLLRITYEASNVDYDSMNHTTRQTFGLYINMTNVSQGVNCVNTTREIIINGNMTTAACNQSDSVSTTALAAPLAVCSFLFISSIIVCIILLSLLLYRTHHRTDRKLKNGNSAQNLGHTTALTSTTSNKNVESKNPAQNTGGPTPESTPNAGPTNLDSTYQPNRFIQNGCNEMLRCKKNYEFLHCLKMILSAGSGHKEFNKDCGELFKTLSDKIDEHMKKIEPQEKDGGKKKVACDGDTQSHIVYTHWEEMTKLILKDLEYTE